MKRLAFVVGATALLVGALVAPAQAAPGAPHFTGTTCGFVTSDLGTPGTQNGVTWGGPLTMSDSTNAAVLFAGHLTCTVKLGIFNGSHSSGGVVCQATGPTATGVAVAGPQVCNFPAPNGFFPEEAYICTQINLIDGRVFYFSGGGWTTSASSSCERAAWIQVNDELEQDLLHSLLDPILCPILAPFFPPDGDVGIFYDCPPYNGPFPRTFSYLVYEWTPSVVV